MKGSQIAAILRRFFDLLKLPVKDARTTNDCELSLRRALAETPLIAMLFLLGSVVQWAMRGRSMCSRFRQVQA